MNLEHTKCFAEGLTMEWLNLHGLLIMLLIMLPNILYALGKKHSVGTYHNKAIELIEQIGRFSSVFLMVFNLPFLTYGYWFAYGEGLYKLSTGFLTLVYCLVWYVYYKEAKFGKAMALALIPTSIFLLSGILMANLPLIFMALVFGFGHCTITYHNNI
jgi:hypothetical protein